MTDNELVQAILNDKRVIYTLVNSRRKTSTGLARHIMNTLLDDSLFANRGRTVPRELQRLRDGELNHIYYLLAEEIALIEMRKLL